MLCNFSAMLSSRASLLLLLFARKETRVPRHDQQTDENVDENFDADNS